MSDTTQTPPWLRAYLLDLARPFRPSILLMACAAPIAALLEATTLVLLGLAAGVAIQGATPNVAPSDGDWGLAASYLADLNATLGSATLFALLMALIVVFTLVRIGVAYLGRALAGHVRIAISGRLRSELFRQFVCMNFVDSSRQELGDQVAYLEQVGYTSGLPEYGQRLYAAAWLLLGYAAVMAWASPWVTLLALGVLLFAAWPIRLLARRIKRYSQEYLAASVRLQKQLVDLLGAVRLIQSLAIETNAQEEADASIQESVRTQEKSYLRYLGVGPGFEAVTVVVALVMLAVVYFYGGAGSLPRLAVFTLAVYRLVPRVSEINQLTSLVSVAWPFVVRVGEMVRREEKRYVLSGDQPVPDLREAIVFRDVSFCYPENETSALTNLSCRFAAGQMTALVGVSGGGKSTMVDLLLRLFDPDAGVIEVDGVDLRHLELKQWRRSVGVVEQTPVLLHRSVYDNIALGMEGARQEEVERAAEQAGAREFIQALPNGFDTLVGDRGVRLSGGERQRIAIARAIIGDPPILLMDEATSNLDSDSADFVGQFLERLRGKRTLIVIAHRLRTVASADQVLVLEQGRVVEQGAPRQLLQLDSRFAHMWRLQELSVDATKRVTGMRG